jgi:predicted GNAT superfamily acetyltransferase
MTYKISVKSFSTTAELNQTREIFDSTWSKDFGTEITPNLLQAMVHGGAYLSGAFREGETTFLQIKHLHFQGAWIEEKKNEVF